MLIFYLNEPCVIVEERKEEVLVQFEDGVREWVSREDVDIYKTTDRTVTVLKHESLRAKDLEVEEKYKGKHKNGDPYGGETRAKRVSRMPCIVPGCGMVPSQNAHVRSRGAGGGVDDIVPLCAKHHHEQHTTGILTFQKKYGVDLEKEAKKVTVFLRQEGL